MAPPEFASQADLVEDVPRVQISGSLAIEERVLPGNEFVALAVHRDDAITPPHYPLAVRRDSAAGVVVETDPSVTSESRQDIKNSLLVAFVMLANSGVDLRSSNRPSAARIEDSTPQDSAHVKVIKGVLGRLGLNDIKVVDTAPNTSRSEVKTRVPYDPEIIGGANNW
jgi:hypothetical protein